MGTACRKQGRRTEGSYFNDSSGAHGKFRVREIIVQAKEARGGEKKRGVTQKSPMRALTKGGPRKRTGGGGGLVKVIKGEK